MSKIPSLFVCMLLTTRVPSKTKELFSSFLADASKTPYNSVLGVYNSCKWNCQPCACVNRSQVVIDNQPETLVVATLGMRLVILVQEPISGNETRFMRCHCMQNCLSSSMTVCLRMWTGRGTRARTQELSATFSSCGQCRLSSESTRVIKTGRRFDTIILTLTYARQLAFDSSLLEISLSIGQPCWGGCWILWSSPSSLPPLPSPTWPPSCRVTTNLAVRATNLSSQDPRQVNTIPYQWSKVQTLMSALKACVRLDWKILSMSSSSRTMHVW